MAAEPQGMRATIDALSEAFDRSLIKKKGKYDYISHGLVTERLNRVFPDWSFRVVEVFTALDMQGRKHCEGVLVGLTIGGVERMEGGGPQRQDGFANEVKNAISDAIKRAAMRFGVALEIWESLVDSEFDEDVHPDRVSETASAPRSAANATVTESNVTPLRRQDAALERVKEVAGAATVPERQPTTRRPLDQTQRTQTVNGTTRPMSPYADAAPKGCNGDVVVKYLNANNFTGDNAYKMINDLETWIAATFGAQATGVVGTGDYDTERKKHKVWPSDIYNCASHYFALCDDAGDPAVTAAAGGITVPDDDEVPF